MKISINDLFEICSKVLVKNGVPFEQAEVIADSIVYAHAIGKGTHGATRLGIYISKIQNGYLSPNTIIECTSDRGVVTMLDANHGFGQVSAHFAMTTAIKKAETFGVGVVGVKHSNNFGTASYFAKMATDCGKIALMFSNAAPAIAPWGGGKPLFGTNPIAFGFPTPEGDAPIILDMAVSNAARGKIRLAAKNGEKIPFGWALDPGGNPTDDPNLAILGSMIPIGDHKGAGLALIVDLFAGLLTGAGFAGGVKALNTNDDVSNNGHFIIVLEPSFFIPLEDYYSRISILKETLKNDNVNREVYLPGERSYLSAKEANGTIEISEKVYQEITALIN